MRIRLLVQAPLFDRGVQPRFEVRDLLRLGRVRRRAIPAAPELRLEVERHAHGEAAPAATPPPRRGPPPPPPIIPHPQQAEQSVARAPERTPLVRGVPRAERPHHRYPVEDLVGVPPIAPEHDRPPRRSAARAPPPAAEAQHPPLGAVVLPAPHVHYRRVPPPPHARRRAQRPVPIVALAVEEGHDEAGRGRSRAEVGRDRVPRRGDGVGVRGTLRVEEDRGVVADVLVDGRRRRRDAVVGGG